MMTVEDIYSEVTLSKKYASLYAPLIMRICGEEYPKYKKDKDRIKAVKNKLHIIYGAFCGDERHKKAEAVFAESGCERSDTVGIKSMCAEIMRLHASTNERLGSLDEFYGFIFGKIGAAESVLDIGCGFNPFSLPYMPHMPKKYYAYDIDCRTVSLLRLYFDLLNLPPLADSADIIAGTPRDNVDAAFIFKLMPVIEIQSPGRAYRLLKEINAGYIVVTYPVKSLCGRLKGMQVNYAQSFEAGIAGSFDIIGQAIIGSELIYIITHKKARLCL